MANQTHRLQILIDANDKASKALGGVGNILKTGVVAGAIAAGAAIAGLGVLMAQSIELASEQQRADTQLAQTLESTRFAAGLTAAELKNLASGLQDVTTYGDEAIIGAENLLLTFTNIKGPIFEDALATILDVSTAMGQDLKTSAVQVGKALQDPVAGLGALSRVGIQFSESQKEAIKTMVEMGDVAGAQQAILTELNTQFGGSAAAAASTYGGRIQQLKNAFGDLKEQIGFAVLPALTSLAEAVLPKVQAAVDQASEAMPSFASAIQEALGGNTQLAIQDFQKGLIQLGFPPEQVESMTQSALQIGEVIGKIGEALGQIDAEDIANTVNAIVSLISGIAQVIEWTAQAVEIGAGLKDQLSTITELNLGRKAEGMTTQQAGAFGPGGRHLIEQGGTPGAPLNITLNSTIQMDGKEVGRAVGTNIGQGAAGLAAVGGPANF